MKIKTKYSLLTLCILVFNIQLKAALRPNALFCDHAILQRNSSVPVWGKDTPHQKVTVSFAGQNKSCLTDANGNWMVNLDALEASFEGKTMRIKGSTETVITDILIGEIWLCMGQSNMALPAKSVQKVNDIISKIKHIRSFEVKRSVALEEQENVSGMWEVNYPNSAVACSFAYELQQKINVPVGIILSCWGSSAIEAWMPKDMAKQFPYYDMVLHELWNNSTSMQRIKEAVKAGEWDKGTDVFLRRNVNIPYNAMIHPLIPYACKGIVWYQGERNSKVYDKMPESPQFLRTIGMKRYGEVLQAFVKRYRQAWDKQDLAFMVVQLPGFAKNLNTRESIDAESPTEPMSWAWMREAQQQVLSLENTYLATAIDLGEKENVHPKDKYPIGERLALLARKGVYGEDILSQGPYYKSMEVNKNQLTISFEYAEGLKTKDGEAPKGFWIAGKDKQWHKATAKIKGNSVILTATAVKEPIACRYAFAGKPEVNLINKAALPAYPFRTDNWRKE